MHILPNITRVERKDIMHEADITEFITGIILLTAGCIDSDGCFCRGYGNADGMPELCA